METSLDICESWPFANQHKAQLPAAPSRPHLEELRPALSRSLSQTLLGEVGRRRRLGQNVRIKWKPFHDCQNVWQPGENRVGERKGEDEANMRDAEKWALVESGEAEKRTAERLVFDK